MLTRLEKIIKNPILQCVTCNKNKKLLDDIIPIFPLTVKLEEKSDQPYQCSLFCDKRQIMLTV